MKMLVRSALVVSAVLLNASLAFCQIDSSPSPSPSPVPNFACQDDWSSGSLACVTGWCGKGGIPKQCSPTGEFKNPKDPNDPNNGKPTCVCVAPAPPPPVDPKSECSSRATCGGDCFRTSWKKGLGGVITGEKAKGTCVGTPGKKCSCETGQLREAVRDTVNQVASPIPSIVPSIPVPWGKGR